MLCAGEIAALIRRTKTNLVQNMRTVYGIYFEPYTHIFDEFYEYLENSVQTGNMCQIEAQFSKARTCTYYL